MALDLWFPQDVARALASIYGTMAASLRASAPLDVETAEAYRQGFVDALDALGVAFGVAAPGRERRNSRTIVWVEPVQPGLGSLKTEERG